MQFFDSKEYEWADIRVHIAGAGLLKLQGIKWGTKQDKEYLYGAGDEPIGIQKGNRSYPCEVTVLAGALADMNVAAKAAGGRDILDLEIPVTITYLPAPGRPLRVVKLKGVQFSEFEEGWTQGDKNKQVTLPAMALGVEVIP